MTKEFFIEKWIDKKLSCKKLKNQNCKCQFCEVVKDIFALIRKSEEDGIEKFLNFLIKNGNNLDSILGNKLS